MRWIRRYKLHCRADRIYRFIFVRVSERKEDTKKRGEEGEGSSRMWLIEHGGRQADLQGKKQRWR